MITLKLKSNPAKSKYWMLSLPAEYRDKADRTLQKLKVDPYTMEPNCYVYALDSALPMHHLVGQIINLHEADHLFTQLSVLNKDEMHKFTVALSTNRMSIKEMINVTQNLDCYRVTDELIGSWTPFGHLETIKEPDMTKYDGISLPPLYRDPSFFVVAKLCSISYPLSRFSDETTRQINELSLTEMLLT